MIGKFYPHSLINNILGVTEYYERQGYIFWPPPPGPRGGNFCKKNEKTGKYLDLGEKEKRGKK